MIESICIYSKAPVEMFCELSLLMPKERPAFHILTEYVQPNGLVTDRLIYATIDAGGRQSARTIRLYTDELGTIERRIC